MEQAIIRWGMTTTQSLAIVQEQAQNLLALFLQSLIHGAGQITEEMCIALGELNRMLADVTDTNKQDVLGNALRG